MPDFACTCLDGHVYGLLRRQGMSTNSGSASLNDTLYYSTHNKLVVSVQEKLDADKLSKTADSWCSREVQDR